jgi:hypothetical protein
MSIPEMLEAAMLLVFSMSWCCSVAKMLACKVSAGKSLVFVLLVFSGYAIGLCAKLILWKQSGQLSAVIFVYGWNMLVVGFDAVLVRRYARCGDAATLSTAPVEPAGPPSRRFRASF